MQVKNHGAVKNMIRIKSATIADIQDIAQLKIDSDNVNYIHPADRMLKELFIHEYKKRWLTYMEQGTDVSIITVDNKLAGLISYRAYHDSNLDKKALAEITHLYVIPPMRRKKLGSLLYLEALKKVKDKGFNTICVWIVEESRQAKRFYEKLGLQQSPHIRIDSIQKKLIIKEVRYDKELT